MHDAKIDYDLCCTLTMNNSRQDAEKGPYHRSRKERKTTKSGSPEAKDNNGQGSNGG